MDMIIRKQRMSVNRIILSVLTAAFAALLYSCGISGNIRISSYFKKTGIENWENSGGSSSRNNYRSTEMNPPLEKVWETKISSAPNEVVVASDQVVYTGTLDGRIYAFDIQKGGTIGSLKFLYAATNGLSVRHQTAIIALASGKEALVSYNVYDNDYNFIKPMPGIETNPLIVEDYIYLADQYNKFYSLNFKDGATLWIYETPKPVRSSPSVSGTAVFFGCDDGTIYALNRFNGRVNWTFKTGSAIYAAPVLDDQNVYIGSTDSTFYAINLKEGTLRWKYKIGTAAPGKFFSSAAVNKDKVIVGATDGFVYAFTKKDGELAWKFQTQSAISSAPVITKNFVYVGSQDSYLYAIDLETGKSNWSFKTAGRIKSNMALYGEYLVVASEAKNVYAFRTSK
ncbi:PQQ-binding-like beta-propeller repeat protein [bacterium]|nr:MAG: PQQ-binding-like beta-propeller repeat protein [bacterium]